MRADLRRFAAALPTLEFGGTRFFDPDRETWLARAPGRLDVMGGIADYSGSLVLQLPLAEATCVAGQRSDAREVVIMSFGAGRAPRELRFPLDDRLTTPGMSAVAARERCARDSNTAWGGYVLGALALLVDRAAASVDAGVRIAITSDVPEAKGVASSAALEIAAIGALAPLFGVELSPAETARLGQRVEHEVVGAPCGIMDQMTSVAGRERHLLALRCQPAQIVGHLPLPPELALWGIDSGVRHCVAGEDYGSVRTAAFMGYRILAEAAGLEIRRGPEAGEVEILDERWHGYLANVTPDELHEEFREILPVTITGADFLDRYHGISDAITAVDPSRNYRVRAATSHPILEHARIGEFAALLAAPITDASLSRLGALMCASHEGYSACGLGSDATDRLFARVREAGSGGGLHGARITGGGSGGTVAILGRAGCDAAVGEIATAHAREHAGEGDDAPHVFAGSSDGVTAHRLAHLR